MIKNDLPSFEDFENEIKQFDVYSTGSFWLDLALGCTDPRTGTMGIPQRSMVEIFGPHQSGKTLLADHMTKDILSRNDTNKVIYISAETPVPQRFRNIGVDLSRIKLWNFRQLGIKEEDRMGNYVTCEEGLNIAIQYIMKDPTVKGVVIDSIKALVGESDILDGKKIKELEDKEAPALRARLYAKFLNQWLSCNNADATLIQLNPTSESIGADYLIGGNDKEKTYGGRYKEALADFRIRCDSSPLYGEDINPVTGVKDTVGLQLFHRVKKNKGAPGKQGRKTSVNFYYPTESSPPRLSRSSEVLSVAEAMDMVKMKGAWYEFPNGKKVCGGVAAEAYLEENPDIRTNLEKQIIPLESRLFSIQDQANAKKRSKNEES